MPVKSTDLRVGNKVKQSFATLTVVSVMRERLICTDFNTTHPCTYEFVDPVPLTEEWLTKLGFEKGELNWFKKSYTAFGEVEDFEERMALTHDVEVAVNTDSKKGCIINKTDKDQQGSSLKYNIQFVHQLQNLFFALTGEELIISETVNQN